MERIFQSKKSEVKFKRNGYTFYFYPNDSELGIEGQEIYWLCLGDDFKKTLFANPHGIKDKEFMRTFGWLVATEHFPIELYNEVYAFMEFLWKKNKTN